MFLNAFTQIQFENVSRRFKFCTSLLTDNLVFSSLLSLISKLELSIVTFLLKACWQFFITHGIKFQTSFHDLVSSYLSSKFLPYNSAEIIPSYFEFFAYSMVFNSTNICSSCSFCRNALRTFFFLISLIRTLPLRFRTDVLSSGWFPLRCPFFRLSQ